MPISLIGGRRKAGDLDSDEGQYRPKKRVVVSVEEDAKTGGGWLNGLAHFGAYHGDDDLEEYLQQCRESRAYWDSQNGKLEREEDGVLAAALAEDEQGLTALMEEAEPRCGVPLHAEVMRQCRELLDNKQMEEVQVLDDMTDDDDDMTDDDDDDDDMSEEDEDDDDMSEEDEDPTDLAEKDEEHIGMAEKNEVLAHLPGEEDAFDGVAEVGDKALVSVAEAGGKWLNGLAHFGAYRGDDDLEEYLQQCRESRAYWDSQNGNLEREEEGVLAAALAEDEQGLTALMEEAEPLYAVPPSAEVMRQCCELLDNKQSEEVQVLADLTDDDNVAGVDEDLADLAEEDKEPIGMAEENGGLADLAVEEVAFNGVAEVGYKALVSVAGAGGKWLNGLAHLGAFHADDDLEEYLRRYRESRAYWDSQNGQLEREDDGLLAALAKGGGLLAGFGEDDEELAALTEEAEALYGVPSMLTSCDSAVKS